MFCVCLCSGFLVIYYFFVVAASWREVHVFGSFCFSVSFLFFLISFCSGKSYFILHVGRVRDSSSAGQSLT